MIKSLKQTIAVCLLTAVAVGFTVPTQAQDKPAEKKPAAAAEAGKKEKPRGMPFNGKLSAVDKDLADKKKQAEAAAAAKIKAEEDRVAKAKAENCERARAGKALMDSGVRVALTNAKGEREILEDAGRAAEHKRILQSIDANCR